MGKEISCAYCGAPVAFKFCGEAHVLAVCESGCFTSKLFDGQSGLDAMTEALAWAKKREGSTPDVAAPEVDAAPVQPDMDDSLPTDPGSF